MIPSFFLPLNRQFDDGIGTVARSYHEAAKQLDPDEPNARAFQSALPVCHLYRHSTELFLKSLLVILWRRFSGSSEPLPSVTDQKGKPKPIDREHGIKVLFDRLLSMCREYAGELAKTDSKLGVFPPGLTVAIQAIDDVDRMSDYFRYPVSKSASRDAEKSSMKPVPALAAPGLTGPGSFTVFVRDDSGAAVETYAFNEQELDIVRAHLKVAADDLSGMHTWYDAVLVAGRHA